MFSRNEKENSGWWWVMFKTILVFSFSTEFKMYTILRIQGESGFSDFPPIQMTEMWP